MALDPGNGEGGTATQAVSTSTGVSGATIVGIAAQQLGKPYDFGANGPDAWDCSSLVQWAYRQEGIDLPRTTYEQVAMPATQSLTLDQLQPGDLVFSDWGDGPNSHVGIYAGNNQLLEAGSNGVAYEEIGPNYKAHITAARRVAGVSGYTGATPAAGLSGGIPTPGDVWDWLTGAAQSATSIVTAPGDALTKIGDGLANMAGALVKFGQVQGKILNFMLSPRRMIIKGTLFFLGIVFILMGIWFLSRELKD